MTIRNRVSYEWDIETCDHHGDIEDHDHADRLEDHLSNHPGLRLAHNESLVLVRDLGNEYDGVVDRAWAYAYEGDDGDYHLPDCFVDGERELPNMRVPQRYHAELRRAQK